MVYNTFNNLLETQNSHIIVEKFAFIIKYNKQLKK